MAKGTILRKSLNSLSKEEFLYSKKQKEILEKRENMYCHTLFINFNLKLTIFSRILCDWEPFSIWWSWTN